MNKLYDVCIIGAGPAGSSLAYWLAKSNIKVILIDKEKFPRKKICAGGLTPRALNILPFDISNLIENEITQATLSYKLKKRFTKTYAKILIYTVKREKFDDFLVQKAKNSGVDFLDGQKIESLKLEGDRWNIFVGTRLIQAKILVGADGANSFVAKNIHLDPIDFSNVALAAEIAITPAENSYKNRIFLDYGCLKNSYGWAFPKSDSLSVGVVGPINSGRQLKEYLFRMLKSLGIQTDGLLLTGHLLNHQVREKTISQAQALLVGEAAGLVNPWTDEGIFYALKSSQIAAKQIKQFFTGHRDALKVYEKIINQEIIPEFKASHFLSRVSGYFLTFILSSIKKHNYSWDVFCRIIRGDRTFIEFKKRLRPNILLKKIFLKPKESQLP